ncbi:GNAT family N-acetyltransferase [Chloroflexota bacterium]
MVYLAIPMEIRIANHYDFERLKKIDHLSINPERVTFIERVVTSGTAWVVSIRAEVVAYAVLDRSYFERPTIAMLLVDSKRRRCGIGNQLVEYLERICGGPELWTSTNLSNTPMQRLLVKRGYHLTGFIDNLDSGDPELFYFKKLDQNKPVQASCA